MKEKKLKPSHWVALSCLLVVLVVSLLAYSVYVPRLQEVENLQTKLAQAKLEQRMWQSFPVAKPIKPEDQAALAALVPTDIDQSRFIKAVRDDEQQSGVEIKDMTFSNQSDSNAGQDGAVNALTNVIQQATIVGKQQNSVNAAKKQTVLTEQEGNLNVVGNYAQVRQFLEKFSQMSRLVTFKHWNLTTEDVVTNVPVPMQSPRTAPVSNVVTNVILKDPLLSDRTPIHSEQAYNDLMNQITTKAQTATTQQDKNMANLEIQQAFNRYMAGLLNQGQAPAITDQPYAGRYIPDANPNIQQVLGLAPNMPENSTSAPTSLLGAPVTSISDSSVFETKVTLNIDFTLYDVPAAQNVLPAPDPIKTYDPTERTNPVEPR